MTALPIDPTDEELFAVVTAEPDTTEGKWRRAFQAGIEAERARAAAETTEEWGVQWVHGVVGYSERWKAETVADAAELPLVHRRGPGPWEVAE